MKKTNTKIKSYTFYSTLIGEISSSTGVDLEGAIKSHIRQVVEEENLSIDLDLMKKEFALLADGDIGKVYYFDYEFFTEKNLSEIAHMILKEKSINIIVHNPDFFTFISEYVVMRELSIC